MPMNKSVPRVLAKFYDTPWAILPSHLPIMQMVLHRWASGIKLSQDDIAAAIGPKAEGQPQQVASQGAVAVLPLYGIISQRMSMMDEISTGGTSTENFSQQFAALMNDASVGAIIINVDSPGGSVYGIQELGDQIFAARGQKKVVAVANSLAASAAYWLATCAEDLYVTPGGEVGSVGVYGAHEDYSKMLDEMGVKTTLISAGKYKTEGNPYEPLSAEAQAYMQSRVDDYYGAFVKTLARNRKTSQDNVRTGFGQGRCLGADDAVKAGMADEVATLDQVIAKLTQSQSAQKPRTRRAAEALAHRLAIEELN
jgi:signal peptide peptidase SppA